MRICVICEGCYPFVAGGVSSWLHGLMRAMPQHEFVIFAIGAQEKQRGHYAYELPENVTQLHDVYLDAMTGEHPRPPRGFSRLSAEKREAVSRLLQCGAPDWEEIFSLFSRPPMQNVGFLLSREFLDLLEEICARDYPYVGFTDYFWTIRSMFLPLLYLLGGKIPEADLYYAVSAGYAGVLGAMAHARTGKPFVLTEHGIYTREREEEILRTNWVPPHFKDLWINMFYMFTRCAYQAAGHVTALFHRASLIQQEIGCDPAKCSVIPNGVDYERLCAIPAKEPNGVIDIGAVVRIVPIKDIKTMLYAFSNVTAERRDVRLHILGPTDENEEYFAECMQLKEDMGLENVVFTGRVDTAEYMRGMDFTLLTSISEGQPLAVLEAMAAGRPAVTTDVGCCRELIEGVNDGFGAAGICVPAMHQTALAEAVLTLCEDANRRKQYGENGRRRVSRMYRLPDMVERYEILFERARRGAGGRYRV